MNKELAHIQIKPIDENVLDMLLIVLLSVPLLSCNIPGSYKSSFSFVNVI